MDFHLFWYIDHLFLRNIDCLSKMVNFQLIHYEKEVVFMECWHLLEPQPPLEAVCPRSHSESQPTPCRMDLCHPTGSREVEGQ